jgi:DNA-directed RNA polymerase I, II, and III subunit RPABC2
MQLSQHLIIYLLSFAVFLVVKDSSKTKPLSKKSRHMKEKTAKKGSSKPKKTSVTKTMKKRVDTEQVSDHETTELEVEKNISSSGRPEDEVVIYNEIEVDLREVPAQHNQILIGPQRLTRFERARITGARSLQLSLGAPLLISNPTDIKDSISLATRELDLKALPISIRRLLPNGLYQDIPIDWLK